MKIALVYKSKMGASLFYAEALAKALQGDVFFHKQMPAGGYDLVIYCAGLTAGNIDGYKKYKTALEAAGTDLWMAVSCLATPGEELRAKTAEKAGMDPEKVFLLRGKMNINRAGLFEKWMLMAFRAKLRNKEQKTQEDRDMIHALTYPTDYCDTKYILPIVKKVREREE
ncbi:MAG: hypothetical protein IKZ21_04865 [Clostridia bacterium]|nr:hypothetical protein [Clostridia bacterium]